MRIMQSTLLLAFTISACDARRAPETVPNQIATHPPLPPISLDVLEQRLVAVCPIQIQEWQRTYSYRWILEKRRYSSDELAFLLKRGPYEDLKPSRIWRDVADVSEMDDRPGVELIFGYYNLQTDTFNCDVGRCPELRK